MPGGQSSSVLGASLEVLEKSTGTSTSILPLGGLGLVAAADDDEGAFDDERLPGDVFGVTGDLD